MCTASGGPKQHSAVPTGSVCGVEGPLVCELWRPPLSVGSASRRGGWGRAAVSCTSAREPGRNSHLLSMFRGNISNSAHRFLWSWVVPSSPGELSWFPTFSGPSRFLCWRHSIGSKLSLTRNCSEYRCTFDVFLGRVSSESNYSIFEPLFTLMC